MEEVATELGLGEWEGVWQRRRALWTGGNAGAQRQGAQHRWGRRGGRRAGARGEAGEREKTGTRLVWGAWPEAEGPLPCSAVQPSPCQQWGLGAVSRCGTSQNWLFRDDCHRPQQRSRAGQGREESPTRRWLQRSRQDIMETQTETASLRTEKEGQTQEIFLKANKESAGREYGGWGRREGRKLRSWRAWVEGESVNQRKEVGETAAGWGGVGRGWEEVRGPAGAWWVWGVCGRLGEMPGRHLLPTALTACWDATVLQSLISLQLLRVFGFGVPV